ncbi:MAG TPA: DUF4241 domain-containing protein [Candidatus Limnocylindrales bacterium]|nr:DUF4241 domain-containing protein [Candidatus Limnocylindrales bacterium]
MDRRAWTLSLVAMLVVTATGVLLVSASPARVADPIEPTTEPPAAEASVPPRIEPADLYAAFGSATTGTSFGRSVTMTVDYAGDVILPTGRLVASDALIIDSLPFAEAVPPGRHAVSVLVVEFADGDRRVAAAMVTVAPNEPIRWELALVAGQDPATLGPGEFFGYGVDSGTGAFTSPEATERLRDLTAYEACSNAVTAGMFPGEQRFGVTVEVEVDRASGTNVVAFSSGFGDGAYPSFVGFDDDGRPAVVLTDFGVLDAAGA